ncbi:MAG TPA: SIMPL domain-containing protein [Pyrinomonadaceae bacterium]
MLKNKFFTAAAALAICCVFAAQAAAASKEITVRGQLRPTVESGGWVIVAGEQKYLLINADRFKGESWFRKDAEVEAVGETKNAITIYMEGTPFEARTLRPTGKRAEESAAASGNGALTGGAAAAVAELTRITVSGEATVQAQPDTAIVSIAVVTQNASASEAQAENASRTEATVRAVKAAAGAGAEVKTGGYSLQPQYSYKPNESPQINGYQVRNSVIVTMSDLTKVGAVIDAASRAGANTVDYLNFTLRRDRPARSQALAEATRDARAKAQTLAEALGGRVVRIVEVQEGPLYRPPVPLARGTVGRMAEMQASADTPVEVGSLDIRAQVQLVAEVEMRP